ncbi:MAG: aspartate aminotransferase family protein [bacterium]
MEGGRSFNAEPRDVPKVETKYRRIVTKLPVPESLEIIGALRKYEPISMSGQPLVVWDRAEGIQVYDKYGNMWLDWSCGVLITNVGHGRKEIRDAIKRVADHGLLANYCFPSEIRAKLVKKLVEVSPPGIDKAFILTTGSETMENAIKCARAYGIQQGGRRKHIIVSFERAFHGRTLGAQMIGGFPKLKEWIVNLDPGMVQVPFPDGFRTPNTSFSLFEESLAKLGVAPEDVAGVIAETYQGGGASFAPAEYMQALRKWCDRYGAILAFDEVQAGFGRTGKYWGFEHYGIVPDLICCGKGISSSLPLSAVLGKSKIMNIFPPGSMTSTHSGSPVPAAATLASLEILEREKLVENSARMGEVLMRGLMKIRDKFGNRIGAVHGKGLVAGLHMVKPGSIEPDGDLAFEIVEKCYEKGLLMFAPVGYGGATVKIAPPLCINKEALEEGLMVIEEAIGEALRD